MVPLLWLLCKDAFGPIVVEVACTQLAAIAVTESVDRKWLASALVVTIVSGVLLGPQRERIG